MTEHDNKPRKIIDLGQLGINPPVDPVGEILDQEAVVEEQLQVEQDFEVVRELLQDYRNMLEAVATQPVIASKTKPESIWARLKGRQVARWSVSKPVGTSSTSTIDYDSSLYFRTGGQSPEVQIYQVVVSNGSKPSMDTILASIELDLGKTETKLKVKVPVRGRSSIKVPASTQQILPTPSILINLVESDFPDDYSRRLEVSFHEGVDLILPTVLNRNHPPKIVLGSLHGSADNMTRSTQFLFDPQRNEFIRSMRWKESTPNVISSTDFVQLTREALGLIPTEEVK